MHLNLPINAKKYQLLLLSTRFYPFQSASSIYQPLFTNEKNMPLELIYYNIIGSKSFSFLRYAGQIKKLARSTSAEIQLKT